MMQQQQWNAKQYAQVGGYVPALGDKVLNLLEAKKGERILDLGCGDGTLTKRISATGASVVGIDLSPELVAAAHKIGVDAQVGNGEQLPFVSEFDAVFSNAALHWMSDYRAVATGVARALRNEGRFVGEFGGHGNIASIITMLNGLVRRYNLEQSELNLWYYPTAEEYHEVLTQAGFKVVYAELIPRRTPIPAGMRAWLRTFRNGFFRDRSNVSADTLLNEAIAMLKPALQDKTEQWTLDYVRLRFIANLKNRS